MKKTLLLIMTALLAFGTSAALAGCGGDNASSAVAETAAVSTKDSASETTVPHATNTATTAPATTAATKPSTAATTAPATKPAQTSRTQTAQTSRTVNNNNTNNTNNNSNQTNNNTNTNTNNNNNNNNNNGSSQQSSKNTPKPTDPPKQEGSFAASDAVFVYNDRQVALNSDMDTVLAALGEANSMTTAPSCIGVGEDKTYHYDGFTVTTYPRGDKDYVMEIKVLDAAIATAKGIRLGSSMDDMTAAYGSGYRTFGYICAYQTNDNKSLQFFVEDGVITEISYAYKVA
ncbi:MAG: hypothetical protein II074_04580 [Ruminococcus sp.]|nr:hypothetical protein [Ruminococcus sp.]